MLQPLSNLVAKYPVLAGGRLALDGCHSGMACSLQMVTDIEEVDMGTRQDQAERRAAARLLGSLGGKTVTDKKRRHLRRIAKKGAKARWAKEGRS
jgi:D-alanyl-D-alanine dipeptidase